MAKAITYNNAGVVEAIKRNSGSTKFYPASYQGIIQAIEDWQGGSSGGGEGTEGGIDSGSSVLPGGSQLPNTGNKEGDLVVIPNGSGDYFMYVFANGSWERLHITTEEVETAGSAPFALVTDDGVTVKNQKDINAYLDQRITALSEKGYDDTQIQADLAQEIADREAGDDDLQGQIDALEAYDDTALTERVDDLEEAVEALPVTVADDEPEGTDGDLWFKSTENALQLFVNYGGEWVVASPPVSTEAIETLATNAEATAQEAKQMAQTVAWQLHQQSELVTWDQERQDLELKVLEGEIEQLAPSFERGAWNYDDGNGKLDGTEYLMTGVQTEESYQEALKPLAETLNKCHAEAGGDTAALAQCNRDYDVAAQKIPKEGETIHTNKWELVNKISFSYMDVNGKGHTFEDVEVGQLLDMVCEDGSGYMVAEITGVTLGMWYEDKHFNIKPLQFKGVANGKTAVKIFSIDDEVDAGDLANFVRKTGDDMTGPLHIKADTSDSNPAFLLEPDNTSSSYSDIMQVRNNEGTLLFYVTNGGTVSSGGSSGYKPSADHHLATKKYVDDQDTIFKPAKYGWKVGINTTNTPAQGYVSCSKGRIEGGVKFKFNLKSMEGGLNMLPFSPSGDITSKEIYRYSGSSGAMTAMVLTSWVYQSGGTQMWKGTGEIREILLKKDCLEVTLNSHTKNNGADFDYSSIYHFTIGGFF